MDGWMDGYMSLLDFNDNTMWVGAWVMHGPGRAAVSMGGVWWWLWLWLMMDT
jgi:hypothetical protein